MNLRELTDDLLAERDDLAAVLAPLDEADWHRPTPAPGWSVLDQVTHLAFFDEATTTAVVDPATFRARRDEALADVDGFVDGVRRDHAGRPGAEVLAWMLDAGQALVAAVLAADPAVRVPWYGPDMSLASSVTSRIMETWAHGQDVVDALGRTRGPSPRLRHVVFLGWRALPNSFLSHGRPVPEAPVRVELDEWTFGPADATDVVRGPALDFCLVVTQRRHPDDTALVAEGPVATEWLTIAQAFAGPPGEGRRPGQFR